MKKNKLTFHFYADPAHGWLKVKIAQLRKLGLMEHITSYSYVKGENAFLEEDCDASTFLQKLKEFGIEPVFKHHYTDRMSRIRKYKNFDCRDYGYTIDFS